MDLKTPKGTTDLHPQDSLIYEELIHITKSIFQTYGAVPIDTPVFELKSILMNKYGEDTKLIYDLKETGGEVCALRYDLTVPFSRYMSMNKLKKLKRYQIGKVYRRDQPSISQGRFREFMQADIDIAGEGLPMLIDSELISCMTKLLTAYEIGKFVIKISDRRILFGILKTIGIKMEMYNTISSTIDKIDKLTQCELIQEFKNKGLENIQIEKLLDYITKKGKEEVLGFLKSSVAYEECKEGIEELEKLMEYCKILNCYDTLEIDLSLARGLDYYTGLIIEGKYINKDVGSVAGGGRYDYLIGSITRTSDEKIPCAGFSIGLSRIFNLVKDKMKVESKMCVFVSASGNLFVEARLGLLKELWEANIPAETFYNKRVNPNDHKKLCIKKNIKCMVIFGENEYSKGAISIIDISTNEKEEIEIQKAVEYIKNKYF